MTRRTMHHALALALAAWLAGAGAMAQPYETPPAPAAPRPLQIATPAEQQLPNGLRVIVAERHGVPLVSARLVVLSGAEADLPQRAGLASMTAGLLTRGTRRHSAPALASAAEALGGSIESGAGWNQAFVGTTVTSPKLSAALALLAEVALVPTFAPAEIERYRVQALDEMKVAYSQPGTVAGLTAQRAVYGAGAYGHPASGTPASLARITRADLQRAHAAAYRPDNAVLVLAGDITMADAVDLARTHFGAWKAPAQPLAAAPVATAQAWPGNAVVIDMPGAGQAGVALALPTMPAGAPERFDAEVTNAVLGMGYSSRLNQEIRIKRGLSYGARSDADLRRQAGALRVAVQTKNPSAAEVVGLIGAELDRLVQAPVGADELSARKASLIGGFSRSLETTQGLADEVASLAVVGLPLADLTQRIQHLDAVTPAQVQGFAASYFGPPRRRVVVAGVASEFLPALKAQAGPVAVVPVQSLDLESPAAPAAP
ncbi:M16 family metallopeptidase [Ideonella sp. BN130291]|uniref:M16 family metallopeptidase n=1 Tax=Ideonella sp. BN130291 TaxID=3112940 RepID=UPI002E260EE9|nr:pitrilysin family protein [Ideonella sp. BN130291]